MNMVDLVQEGAVNDAVSMVVCPGWEQSSAEHDLIHLDELVDRARMSMILGDIDTTAVLTPLEIQERYDTHTTVQTMYLTYDTISAQSVQEPQRSTPYIVAGSQEDETCREKLREEIAMQKLYAINGGTFVAKYASAEEEQRMAWYKLVNRFLTMLWYEAV